MRHSPCILAAGVAIATAAMATASPGVFRDPQLVGTDRNGPPLEAADLVDWDLALKNVGYTDTWAVVTAGVPPSLELLEASDAGVYDPASGRVTWSPPATPDLGWIAPGQTVFLHLTTRVACAAAPAAVSLQASVLGDLGEFASRDPRVSAAARPSAVPADGPLLDVRLAAEPTSPDGRHHPGDAIRYRLRLENLGSVPFTELGAALAIPATVESVALVALPAGAVDESRPSEGTVAVSRISVPVGSAAVVAIDGVLSAGAATGATHCTHAVAVGSGIGRKESQDPSPAGGETCFTVDAGDVSLARVFPCLGTSYGGDAILLQGSGFEPGAVVTIGGLPAVVESVSPTRLLARSPRATDLWDIGPGDVTVANPGGAPQVLAGGWMWTVPWIDPYRIVAVKSTWGVEIRDVRGYLFPFIARSSDARFPCAGTSWFRLVDAGRFYDRAPAGELLFYRTD